MDYICQKCEAPEANHAEYSPLCARPDFIPEPVWLARAELTRAALCSFTPQMCEHLGIAIEHLCDAVTELARKP